MLTAKQAAAQKKALRQEIAREHRRAARQKLRELAAKLKDARARRRELLREASDRCKVERLAARERARMLREQAMQRLRDAVRADREAARSTCAIRRQEARATGGTAVEQARSAREAERHFQMDLRRIERGNRKRKTSTPRASQAERRSESDDEVRANIPADLIGLFEKVKRQIKAGPRQSRTEAFLQYAEQHPGEVLAAIDDSTDRLIRDLERQQRAAAKAARPPSPGPRRARPRYSPEELAAVPF